MRKVVLEIKRAARTRRCSPGLLAVLIALLAAPLCWSASPRRQHSRLPSIWILRLDKCSGLEIVVLRTSQGRLRMVVDTGSNATTLETFTERVLTVHLDGLDVRLPVHRVATPVLAEFNRSAARRERVNGILGGDFFRQFDLLQLDYRNNQLILTRLDRRQGREVSSAGVDNH